MCGIVAIAGGGDAGYSRAPSDVYNALIALQHRGQDAAGIVAFDAAGTVFHEHRGLGLVADVFQDVALTDWASGLAIGHTRYATVGTNEYHNMQPMYLEERSILVAAHNGNLVNYHEMVRYCQERWGLEIRTSNDVEVLLQLWHQLLNERGRMDETRLTLQDAVAIATEIFHLVDGGYALVGLMASGELFAVRDPQGIRPMVLGAKSTAVGHQYCIASETTALQAIGFTFVRDVSPGEVIVIDSAGRLESGKPFEGPSDNCLQKQACMFEWVYFASADSVVESRSVYAARLELGRRLARTVRHGIASTGWTPDIVCPVPDTARLSAIGLSEVLKIPYREIFMTHRHELRSFILNTPEERERAIRLKLSPIVSEIDGRRILLVDDSVVRGTTSRNIAKLLYHLGAKSVAFAIACPPIRYPCFYGIDFPDAAQLAAAEKTVSGVAEDIGVEYMWFLEEQDLMDVLGTEVCIGCLSGRYPTEVRGHQEFLAQRRRNLAEEV